MTLKTRFCKEELIKEWGPTMSVIQIWSKKKQVTFQLLRGTVGQVKRWKIRKNQRLYSQNSKLVFIIIFFFLNPKNPWGISVSQDDRDFKGLSRDVYPTDKGWHKPARGSFMATFCTICAGSILLFLEIPYATPALLHLKSLGKQFFPSNSACPSPNCWKASSRELKGETKQCCCILEL